MDRGTTRVMDHGNILPSGITPADLETRPDLA